MDDTTKTKLQTNIANSWKMYSVRFVSVFSLAATAAIGWFLSLPTTCSGIPNCTTSQASFLAQFGIGAAALPIIAGALAYWARVHPQSNLTPAVAEAKSATTGPAEVAQPPVPPTN